MTWTAYIDESKRKGYLLCAVVVRTSETGRIRAALNKAKGNRSELHMVDVHKDKQLPVARLVAGLGGEAFMFTARGGARERIKRDMVLKQAALYLADTKGCTDIVIESCSMDAGDRQLLHNVLGPDHPMQYRHADKSDVMLALPDVYAWCWGAPAKFKTLMKTTTFEQGVFHVD